MQDNALLIRDYLINDGWSIESIAGMLGNMQYESNINPGIYEGLDSSSTTNGYGLVQWTPNTKYKNWVDSTYGDADYGNLYYNLDRINYELANNIQWIPRILGVPFPNMTFAQFKVSTASPFDLAVQFVHCYERPLSPNNFQRGTAGNYWYTFLTGNPPIPPSENVKKTKFKWVLYARKLRNKKSQ